MAEDEIDIQLRTAADVAARVVILSTLLRRLWIESQAATVTATDLDGEAYDLREWLRGERHWDDLTLAEAAILETPPGKLSEDDAATIAWQSEGLATLGWALGLTGQLGSGYPADVATVVLALPEPWDDLASWVRDCSLRPEKDIAGERDLAEIIAWRAGIEEPMRGASAARLAEYAIAIAEVVREATAAGYLGANEPDLLVNQQPLTSFTVTGLQKLVALAAERLRALNWLCGFGDSWDRVPLDV